MKLAKVPDPGKFKDMSKTELTDRVMKEEKKKAEQSMLEAITEHRVLRIAGAGATSLVTGILYEKKPDLENLMGTPASLDHFAAVIGTVGAFYAKDEETASILEGVGTAGLCPLMRNVGRRIGVALS